MNKQNTKQTPCIRKGRLLPLISVCSILVFILFFSIISFYYISNTCNNFQDQIDDIKKLVTEDNWTVSELNASKLTDQWEKEKPLMSILIDHRKMELIDVSISRSNDYVKNRSKTDSLVELNQTAQQIYGIYMSEIPTLFNIF